MIVNKLSDILNKSLNRKYKKGFILYLKSLDYEEFSFLFSYYCKVLLRLIDRYKKKKPTTKIAKIKKWFSTKILNYKYDLLFQIFGTANIEYLSRINEDLKVDNNRIDKLLSEINEVRTAIETLSKNNRVITQYSTKQDYIDFYIYIVCNIYNTEKLQKLINELDNLKHNGGTHF